MIVWISLGAVIVIIIVIGVLFRLFLRADDADPFDELPDEPIRPSRAQDDARLREPAPREAAAREPVAAAAARRQPPRQAPVDDQPRPADRGPRGPEDRGQPGYRERGGQDRQAGPDRRNSGGQSRPVPAGARPARPRSAEAAAQTAKWDKMSDVDYWTELAADNAAEVAAAAPVSSAPARRRTREPVADIRAAARGDRSADPGDRTVQLPVRQRPPRARTGGGRPADYGQPQSAGPQPTGPRPAHAPGRYAGGTAEPATQSIAALARLGSQPPVPQPPAAQPAAAQLPVSQPRRKARPVPPPPLDDDPLTSPSFPAINASDSRSYRTSRPDTQPGRVPAAPAYADPPAAAYNDPAQQLRRYPAATDRVVSQPGGYPVQPAAPVGNPYGSFVTQPAPGYQQQAPAASPSYSSQDQGYGRQDQGYGRQDPGYGQPAQADGWYGANGQPAAQAPLPAFSAAPPGTPGGYLNGGQIPNGHDPGGNQVSYQGGQPEAAQYPQPAYPAVQYDQRGYAGQEAGYGLDGYQGYPGYGTGGH